MNKTSILTLGILVTLLSVATSLKAQRTCGTDAAWAQVLADNPKYKSSRIQLEQSIQNWIQANPNYGSQANAKKVIYTIPVVVHVVYNSGSQNISDAQVLSQIAVLNEDFRRTNADASNTPSAFLNVAADCEIEFCLAVQDPSGNPTNGITRTQTSNSSFGGGGQVKSNSSGGKDGWPRNDYLNIWVCNLGSGLLGYALFPGGPAASDGVVIDYQYFGTTGTVSSPFNKGRTTTHEVGHWLALYHSFDGGCAGTSSSTCGSNGDRCCDTPPTSSNNYFCPGTQNTCTETPVDQNDMTMNYMDYVNDNCMNLFTLDQKDRMIGVMTGSRASLQFSQGCVSLTLNALDAGISLILSPTGTACATSVIPVVKIENFGTTTLTSATINYDIDGGPNNTYTWSGSLSTGQTQDVTLPSMTVTAGSHTFNSNTTSPNGGTDQDGGNDASSIAFTIAGSTGSPLPFTEGFENTTFPPPGWTLDNPEANATFTRDATVGGFGSSSASAKMDFYSIAQDISGESDYLYSVNLDLSNASSPTVMDFNLAYTRFEAGWEDSLIIRVSSDCGVTWTMVWQDGSTTMQTAPDDTTLFVPTSAQWSAETVNLDAYNGMGSIQIQFEAASGWGNNLYLDDINIYTGGGGGSAPVANFSANATSICAGSTVTFSDLSSNSPTSLAWTFTGGSPSTSSSTSPTITYSAAGTYTVTLTATNGNGSDTKTSTSYITVNAAPSGSMSSTNAGCGSCDGTATAVGSGGTGPYNYVWNTSPAQNGGTASNLCAGSYTVVITDANGCSGSQSTSVGSAGNVSSTTTSTDASCSSCDGTGTVTGSGGTPPYAYSWSNGNTTASVTNLCAGVYTVTVSDNAGCTSVSTINVGSGGSITASSTSNNTTCAGSCDGSASASGSGGSTPYAYAWSTSPVQNSSVATGLCAGSYIVTVTDASGCSTTSTVTVSNGPSMSISVTGIDVSCNGNCDGEASANATGGTAPFNYFWNTTPSQATSTATGLCAGTYGVNITDAAGCSTASTVTISEPSSMILVASGSNASCGSSDGTATASASNGATPYNYLWSNGQTSSMAVVLSAGVYNVTVVDNNGCSQTTSVAISNNGAPTTFVVSSNVLCNGGNDGASSVSASGGQPPYVFNWSNAIASSTGSVNGLSVGTYTVTVTDSAGCIATEIITVTEPAAVEVTLSYLQVSSGTSCDGSAIASATGGMGSYNYIWNDPASQTTAMANGLCLGTVGVIVTDGNGCSSSSTIYVDSIVMSVQNIVIETLEMAVFPNPTSGEVHIRFTNTNNKNLVLNIFNLSGQLIINENLGKFGQDIYTIDLSNNESGIYFIRIIEDNNHIITKKISIFR